MTKRLKWTDEEVEILKKYYPTGDMDELLKMLPNRTLGRIRDKANKLGIKREVVSKRKETGKMLVWTDEEVDLLKKVYADLSNKELLEMFPRFDIRRIRNKARRLGLEKTDEAKEKDKQERIEKLIGDSIWTDEEIRILKENYEVMGAKGLMKLLPNRTRMAIATKALKLGLITNQEAQWVNTDVKFSADDVFSIQVTFERIDR